MLKIISAEFDFLFTRPRSAAKNVVRWGSIQTMLEVVGGLSDFNPE